MWWEFWKKKAEPPKTVGDVVQDEVRRDELAHKEEAEYQQWLALPASMRKMFMDKFPMPLGYRPNGTERPPYFIRFNSRGGIAFLKYLRSYGLMLVEIPHFTTTTAYRIAVDIDAELAKLGIEAARDPQGETVGHARWLAIQIILGEVRDKKADRWVGYLQALLIFNSLSTLDAEKERNTRLKDN